MHTHLLNCLLCVLYNMYRATGECRTQEIFTACLSSTCNLDLHEWHEYVHVTTDTVSTISLYTAIHITSHSVNTHIQSVALY